MSREEAERRIKEINEPYKMEILQSIVEQDPSAPITIYHIGEMDHPMHWYAGATGQGSWQSWQIGASIPCAMHVMCAYTCMTYAYKLTAQLAYLCRWDLCAGPHVGKTSDINMDAVKLESVAGAYWRGDENRQMLQVGRRQALGPTGG